MTKAAPTGCRLWASESQLFSKIGETSEGKMLRWVAIYTDDPQREAIIETTGDKANDLSLFQRAAVSRELFGRPVNVSALY